MKNSILFVVYMGIAALLAAVWFITTHSGTLLTCLFWYIVFVCVWAYCDGLYRRSTALEADENISDRLNDVSLDSASVSRIYLDTGIIYEEKDFRITKAQRILLEFKKS